MLSPVLLSLFNRIFVVSNASATLALPSSGARWRNVRRSNQEITVLLLHPNVRAKVSQCLLLPCPPILQPFIDVKADGTSDCKHRCNCCHNPAYPVPLHVHHLPAYPCHAATSTPHQLRKQIPPADCYPETRSVVHCPPAQCPACLAPHLPRRVQPALSRC